MKKKLEDYLHLYPGATIEWPNYFGSGLSTGILDGVQANHAWATNHQHGIPISELTIYLRPLSSMTEEEKIRLLLWEFPNYKSFELSKNNTDDAMIVGKNENGLKCYINQGYFSSETNRKLLKAGFDLFSLIDAGLALDKTKLP